MPSSREREWIDNEETHFGTDMTKASMTPRCKILRCGSWNTRTWFSSSSPERTKDTYSQDEGEMLSIDSLFLKHYFGFRSCIFSMTGKDQNLIIVFIRRIVVDHGCHSQLETNDQHRSRDAIVLPFRYLFYLCTVQRSCTECREQWCRSPSDKWFCSSRNQHWRKHSSSSLRQVGREIRRQRWLNGWRSIVCVHDWSAVQPKRERSIASLCLSRQTYDQSIGLPAVRGIQIVTAGSVGSQSIVGSEIKWLISDRWLTRGLIEQTEVLHLGDIHFPYAKNERSMTSRLIVIQKDGGDILLVQIYIEINESQRSFTRVNSLDGSGGARFSILGGLSPSRKKSEGAQPSKPHISSTGF